MIGIILLNYNSSSKTNFCLKSIELQTYTDYKVYIADNNSTISDKNVLKELVSNFKHKDKIILFELKENIGFARANNFLIDKAFEDFCEYIYILNNDVEILEDTLSKMLSTINQSEDIIVTNKILFRNSKSTIWFAGGIFDYKNADYITIGYNQIDNNNYNKIYFTEWASGASSFYKKNFFEKIGKFDELFFFGQEEWDISVRALENNYKIIYDGNIPVYHEVGGSTKFRASFKIFLNTYNRLYFAKKHLRIFDKFIFNTKYLIYSFTIKRLKLQISNNIKITYKKYYYIQYLAYKSFLKNEYIDENILNKIEMYYND